MGRARRSRTAVSVLVPVLLLSLCAFGLTIPASPVAEAASGDNSSPSVPLYCTRLYLQGERMVLPAPALLREGLVFVPARGVFEQLGATVLWESGKLTVKTPGSPVRRIELWLGQTSATVDGRVVQLGAGPFLWQSRLMVPIRIVAENLGLAVAWDEERRAVRLETAQAGQDPSIPVTATTPIRDVRLAFAGDTLLGFAIGDVIAQRGVDWPWGGVAEVLKAADLTMVNLECSVSTRGSPMPNKKWTFRAAPESLAGVRNAGIDVVSIANNHVLDFGLDAFLDTLSYLDEYGIKRVGGGQNLAEALQPAIFEVNGFKIGYLAAAAIYPVNEWVASDTRPGILPTHYETAVLQAVKDLASQVDCVVVGVHWGVEREHNPNAYQQRYGRALIDSGADLVIGHHPHVLEGMEIYKGGLIAYSLGNFVFTTATRDGQDSGILVVTLDTKGIAAARLIPVYTDSGRPELEGGLDYERILTLMNTWSEKWGTEFDPLGNVMLP